ncbi:unnamed protein product [Calicophoron daubneyi]|uniref:Uncharacterized protein n=1 Tax=Calicophoron daubneyi TaxID=300641 RepID=A0AAV2TAW7_CALDB
MEDIKLLCAYHHQIQHRGYQAKYAYGHVLAVREFQVSIQQKCPECNQNFYDWREVADHWLSGPCSSPFLPVSSDSDGSSPPAQLTEVVCTMCNAHFDRVPRIPQAPVFKAAPHSGSKRKWIANGDEDADNHKDKILKTDANSIPSSSAVSVDGFARFCLNHAESHLRRCTSGTMICILRVRFIRLEKGTVGILPAYTHPSEDAILLYSMYECKRLVSYLKDFHCHRKSLWRSAKNQLTQILTHSNPYLHSQTNAFFIS